MPPSEVPANPLRDTFLQIDQAEQLRRQGKLDRAYKIADAVVRAHPDYVAGLHTLGLIQADRKNPQQALNSLIRAVMLNPHNWMTLTALSGVYLELGAREMAAVTLEQALSLEPRNAAVLATLGEIYLREREYEKAKSAFGTARSIEYLEAAETGYGWACLHLGQSEDAVRIFKDLLARGVRSLEVLSALAYSPVRLIDVDLLSETEAYMAAARARNEVIDPAVAFVHAIALDRAGRQDDAWVVLERANRDTFATLRSDFTDALQRQRLVMQALRGNQPTVASPRDDVPLSLFVLGPSRSGKTTLEMLIGTLPGVKRGYENPIVDISIKRAFQNAGLLTSEYFEALPPQLYPSCRETYLKELGVRAAGAKVFTNTHPARIYDAGLLAAVFPNVRFVFLKRNIDDVTLRIYQRRYQSSNSYAYDLAAARDHVAWYYDMIDLIAQKLPSQTRVIQYEDMVANPLEAVQSVAELCGLPRPDGPLPPVGDDRGAAQPYRQRLA